jgi:GNAT superfamily N-acetyltransferase
MPDDVKISNELSKELQAHFGNQFFFHREVLEARRTYTLYLQAPMGPYAEEETPKQQVAMFNITTMPGCCGICLSTGSFIHPSFRGQGIGKLLNKLRIEFARNLGYGLLLCTDRDDNTASRKILQANGWKDVYQFINPKTGNLVHLSVKDLT